MMPAVIQIPTETSHGYWPATVVAAIPLDSGPPTTYAVTAKTMPHGGFIAAEVTQMWPEGDGPWVADETFPSDTLSEALADMASLASRVHLRFT